ncbi:MAG: excinuclease ABC subunit UvrA [candidate division KSB1 bacterium]|nr:excinuclease ABC subunit UvrA [candidate division KSB1 bacterium]MDZ7413651.1 excinuclease ABC subunit UvrA [candidate division KSB1 bacterium]
MSTPISIRGARTHNLKNISLDLPRNKLTVITGVSGSGKSSLAFDTLYAEGQRRYVESLSSYARQFLERMDRPDVDEIRGIPPAVAIEQKNPTRTSRSTVATATEVHDYLRLLYARIGRTFCPQCGQEVRRDRVEQVVDELMELPLGTSILIAFPCSHDQDCQQSLEILAEKGFHRLLVSGQVVPLSQASPSASELTVLVDRVVIKQGVRDRLADSVGMAFAEGGGRAEVHLPNGDVRRYSQAYACARCGLTFLEPQPRLFSFNNPYGACKTCKGFGDIITIDEDLVVPDKQKSLAEGAIAPWNTPTHRELLVELLRVAPRHGIDVSIPYAQLSPAHRRLIWEGVNGYPGINGFFDWLEGKRYKIGVRVFLSRYRGYVQCPDCGGSRLRPEALYVRVGGVTIAEVARMTLAEARRFFDELQLTPFEQQVAGQILRELRNRLSYLDDVGLGYLTLDRRTATLSGGEYQRINLATALGAKLVGTLYVLDEPTIGLHPRDTQRLIAILKALRDIGNTVVVVEHDREMMAVSDFICDLGPRAGADGGQIVYQGTYQGIRDDGHSLTGAYLRGNKQITLPDRRRTPHQRWLEVVGAREHNLKSIDVRIPLGLFVVVSGVSGSGKSSLVYDVLYAALMKHFGKWQRRVGAHTGLRGAHYVDDVVLVDQSPIGRTPRSNPATYVKAWDPIRHAFAETRQARIKGLKPRVFSFNVPGGRCEACEGAGAVKVEMQFLADLFLPCEVCGGKRFRKEILEVRYRGKNIAEVLDMSVDEALAFFSAEPQAVRRLQLLHEVGLGYMKLGQPATTLSGGEAQRVKLAAHLAERAGKHVLYIFDEPTTGLHFDDVATLLSCFERLVEAGNTVLVIEHNMDVIKCADYVIDLGPEGGDAGGYVVATGTPEEIAEHPNSHTGRFLREYLKAA